MTRDPNAATDITLPRFDLDRFLPYRLTVAAQRLSDGFARRYREEFGLSVAEWRVLVHLVQSGEVSVRDIGRHVNLQKSKASRAASRLEADGLIAKGVNEADRRLLILTLTDSGRALMAELLPLAVEYQRRLERLVADQLPELDAAIETLLTSEL